MLVINKSEIIDESELVTSLNFIIAECTFIIHLYTKNIHDRLMASKEQRQRNPVRQNYSIL